MALFEPAIEHTLTQEGGFAHFPTTGEYANFGITHWLLRDIGMLPSAARTVPASPDEVSFVKSLPLSTAKGIYWAHFWKPALLDDLKDQPVANKVFDLHVNTGQGVRLLQRAVNCFLTAPARIQEDNVAGPFTINAANAIPDQGNLLAAVRTAAETQYRAIIKAQPVLAPNLKSWLARLAR